MTTTVDRDDKGYWLLARDGKRVEKHGPFPTPGAMRAWEELNITTGVEDDRETVLDGGKDIPADTARDGDEPRRQRKLQDNSGV